MFKIGDLVKRISVMNGYEVPIGTIGIVIKPEEKVPYSSHECVLILVSSINTIEQWWIQNCEKL